MNRDEEFCELAEQITAGLYRRALLVTRDPQLAEDLTQETLTRLYVNFRRVRSQDNPRGYAFTILYRLAIDRSRRRSSHEVPSHELPDPGSSADQTELGLDLTRRLAQLDPELVTDAKGTSWAAIGLDDVRWHPYSAASCRQAGCTTTKVGTATMATTIDTERVGAGHVVLPAAARPARRLVRSAGSAGQHADPPRPAPDAAAGGRAALRSPVGRGIGPRPHAAGARRRNRDRGTHPPAEVPTKR